MKKALLILFISLSALFLPALSGAEIRQGSIEISPFVGYCTGSTAPDLCHKDVYGARLGYALTPNWVIEGAYEGVGTSAASMWHAAVLYHFMPEKTFNPFLIAGGGVAHVRPIRGDSYDTVMGDIGVGFKYWLSQNIAFRTEIRDVMTHSQNSVVTAGLTFALGGKKPKSALTKTSQPVPESKPEPAPAPVQEPTAEKKVEPSTPAPAAAPSAVAPVPETKVATPPPPAPAPAIVLEDIHYDFNKAFLTPAAKEILNRNAQVMKDNPDIRVQIEGYACAHGNSKKNKVLSERRANMAKEYLIKQGIPAGRLTTISYGESRLALPEIPTKKNKNSREAKANRRVHFEVLAK